ncbi:MAG: 4-hydroxybenzoyl-CoA thioesterase [Burkholderiales bacterium RIFCSPLOWO2_12_FULL_61_40]|nr:MAG: 4-hydroxybenzoyl-CoA thioesterase [Burkholderiales bacterium RIFCSPLOWO2_12_FULL_61_40]
MQRSDFRFIHRMRVRWSEVDMQKIVFNAHYLTFFDTAMGEYWRALALPYEAALRQLGGDLYVKKSTLEYHASAQFDDMMEIGLKCVRMGTSSIAFHGSIYRGDTLLVSGELIYVFADPATQSSRPVPAALREVFESYEAGQAMVRLELGPWAELGPKASELRTEVFVDEQGIAPALVWDEYDAPALHAVAFNRLGQTVACGRLVQHSPAVGRIGRMAVSRVLRGSRLGRDVLNVLVQAAQKRGDRELMLHAQHSAEGFYTGLDFTARGVPFEEAGIAHIEMVRSLPVPQAKLRF